MVAVTAVEDTNQPIILDTTTEEFLPRILDNIYQTYHTADITTTKNHTE